MEDRLPEENPSGSFRRLSRETVGKGPGDGHGNPISRSGGPAAVRRLAVFAGGVSLGIFLAQYLLEGGWPLAAALASLALGVLALALPGTWRRRPECLWRNCFWGMS